MVSDCTKHLVLQLMLIDAEREYVLLRFVSALKD